MARVPEGTLMQRAASGLAVAVADLLGGVYGARVLLLVGAGDNGGDALYAGALLARRGAGVEAVLLSDKAHDEGVAALRAAGGRVVTADEAAPPDVVLDGIVGIGGRPGLRPDAERVVARFAGTPVVAVDVPSGVDVDTGRLEGPHVRADVTVTFGTHKVAHLVDPAAQACGVVHLVDIGLDLPEADLTALQAADVAALLPVPRADDHKYTRGVVGVRAGSARLPRRRRPVYGGRRLGSCRDGALRGGGGRPRCAPPTRTSWSGPGGSRPGWSGPAGPATPSRRWPTRSRTGCRSSPTPTRSSTWSRRARPREGLDGPTPDADHPARRRARPPARCRACGGRVRPARARPSCRAPARRGGHAQGPAHARRRPRRTGAGDHDRRAVAGDGRCG